ncbi:DUF5312 domain-containing protein [Treponema sp. C6A8]|uniref:DUF5312 domain-containing protein n=1 Tax=Treponema sp. C6A8 TaxID=1410609 RepID=UPI000483D909|nr:DUF5312 domain-containing protein [Treponema sp. C6A8]
MPSENNRTAFDRLVTGLSAQDRNEMLRRINGEGLASVQLVETEDETTEKNMTLHLKFQTLPLIHKILIKIKAIFTGKTSERVYNDSVLMTMAKNVNREHPGLINSRLYYLDNIFYERLKDLKLAADFFKPFFAPIDNDPGEFYVFLSSFVAPEISDKINSEADPFTLPYDIEPSPMEKDRLLKNLDNIFSNLDATSKANLYSAVQALSWLKQFSVLPFLHFTAQFTNIVGFSYSCPYRNAAVDYDIFAAIFSNIYPVTSEILEALFMYMHKNEFSANPHSQELERSVKEFMAGANSKLAAIQMFISSVPVLKIGKIINQDYDWQPGNIAGAEAWFPKFRAQWREIIEIRWKDWIKERKKSLIAATLHDDFQLIKFPELKYQPWTALWSKVQFNCELTGGFMSWFNHEMYHNMLGYLNDIVLEGIFNGTQSRTEYTSGFNLFQQANQKMADLLASLSPNGDYGLKFTEWARFPVSSVQMQNQIKTAIGKIETEIRSVVKDFTAGTAILVKFLSKLFSPDSKRALEVLQNYTQIKGRGNREWRDKLEKVYVDLTKCVYYISEVEPIELGL